MFNRGDLWAGLTVYVSDEILLFALFISKHIILMISFIVYFDIHVYMVYKSECCLTS